MEDHLYFISEDGCMVGPFKNCWETAKAMSSYLLFRQGCGDNIPLYLDLDKMLKGMWL